MAETRILDLADEMRAAASRAAPHETWVAVRQADLHRWIARADVLQNPESVLFDLDAHVEAVERRGNVCHEFARRAVKGGA